MKKETYICSNCKLEWEETVNKKDVFCPSCGCEKIHKARKHHRASKRSRQKERWNFKF